MRAKRIAALALTGCLLFGQTTWAADVVSGESMTEETEKQQEQSAEKEDGQNSNAVEETDEEQNRRMVKQDTVVQSAEVQSEEMNVYIGQNKIIYEPYTGTGNWTVKSDNEEICKVEVLEEQPYEEYGSKYYHIRFNPIAEGETYITVNNGSEVVRKYHVTIKAAPEDMILFNDTKVEKEFLRRYDKDKNGYISKNEIETVTSIYFGHEGIVDLTGIESVENLKYIDLTDNKYLTDITALLKLKNLKSVHLIETGVPTSEKWKIAKFESNLNMILGDQRNLILNGEIFDEDEINVNDLETKNIIQIKGNKILATATGEATFDLSGDGVHKINVKVAGISANQNVKENSEATIKEKNKSTILGTNGELWQLYPEKKQIDNNVKHYVGGWIYAEGDSTEYAYYLKNDNSLWNGTEKIANDVKKFSGRYILNDKDELIDIYDTNATTISDVKEWNEIQRVNYVDHVAQCYSTLYVLKKDGTLWKREEVKKGTAANTLEQVAENVKEFNSRGYLLEEGGYVSLDKKENIEDAVELPKMIEGIEFYISKDGHTYINTSYSWEEKNWVDVGKTEVVNTSRGYYTEDGYSKSMVYYLTKDGEFYNVKEEGTIQLVADKVKEIKSFDYQIYIGMDGLARTFKDKKIGTPETPVVVDRDSLYDDVNEGEWHLVDYGVAGDYNFLKNDILILTHVKEIFRIEGAEGYDIFAVRTDGTIWDINGVPEQVLDLNTKVTKGDINADGEVDIQDLRSILRYICEKEEFNEDQKSVADVDANGEVDIKDLRKVIRYVSGKESAL